jgi:hypothetical protein
MQPSSPRSRTSGRAPRGVHVRALCSRHFGQLADACPQCALEAAAATPRERGPDAAARKDASTREGEAVLRAQAARLAKLPAPPRVPREAKLRLCPETAPPGTRLVKNGTRNGAQMYKTSVATGQRVATPKDRGLGWHKVRNGLDAKGRTQWKWKRGEGRPFARIEIDGTSWRIPDAAARFGIEERRLRGRLRAGWPPRAAVGLDPRRSQSERLYERDGVSLPLFGWARRCGVNYSTAQYRVKRGWSPWQAIGLEPRPRETRGGKRKGDRDAAE